MSLYNEQIEALIDAALADGILTEKEKQILFKKAQAEGIDLDEFEMVLDARLVELQKKQKAEGGHSAPKSDKFGDVRKCPSCGALVPALAVSCPECGYEFSGVSSSSSSVTATTSLRTAKLSTVTFGVLSTKVVSLCPSSLPCCSPLLLCQLSAGSL